MFSRKKHQNAIQMLILYAKKSKNMGLTSDLGSKFYQKRSTRTVLEPRTLKTERAHPSGTPLYQKLPRKGQPESLSALDHPWLLK